jgi:predicted nucleotidyltransferase
MIDLRACSDPDITVAARVLAALDASSRLSGADCMVVGATARNILSVAWFDRLPSRATRDVDVAVAVATWEAFNRLTEGLTRRGGAHSFSVPVDGVSVEVDIVPYGGVESPDRSVLLPDDHLLNVLGIREVFAAADAVRLPGDVAVHVPTVPGLALLKIIAWAERRLLSRRDATDLGEVLDWYAQGPFLDDLYEDADGLARYDFDVALVGAYRLGRDIAAIAGLQALTGLLSILCDDDLRPRLVNDMGHATTRDPRRLQALTDGLRGT